MIAGAIFTIVWSIVWFLLLDTSTRTYLFELERYGFGVNGYLVGGIPFSALCLFMAKRRGARWGIGAIAGTLALLIVCLGVFIFIAAAGRPVMRY